jgi:Ca2+-binding RTX toxin-like protein
LPWFSFTDASGESFAFRLTDRAKIAEARAILDGIETDAIHVAGTVVKSPIAGNVGWSFHLDEASIFFFEVSAEVGDSTMRLIEDDLSSVGGAFLPGGTWTGWSSELVNELNVILGNDRIQALFGGAAADLIFCRGGDDIAFGGARDDWIEGESGDDDLTGGVGRDRLDGGDGNDRLSGGSGGDVLVGGRGRDALRGGNGTDLFVIAVPGAEDRVLLADFESGEHIQVNRSILAGVGDRDSSGTLDSADLALAFEISGDALVYRGADGGRIVLANAASIILSAGDFWLVG